MKTPNILSLVLSFFVSSIFSQEDSFAKFEFQTQPSEDNSVEQAELSIKFILFKNEKSEFSNTFLYRNTSIKKSDALIFSDEQKNFNSLDYTLGYTYNLSESTAVTFRVNPSVNFETGLDASDFSLFGNIDFMKKFNSKTKLSVGVQRNKLFGKPQILPSISFSYSFKDDIHIDLGFPTSKISYSNNERNKFSIENSYNGYFYTMDNEVPNFTTYPGRISFSQMSAGFQYDRKFDQKFTVIFKGGYDFNRKLSLNDSENTSKHDFKISDGPTFKIGIKYQL